MSNNLNNNQYNSNVNPGVRSYNNKPHTSSSYSSRESSEDSHYREKDNLNY